MSHTHARAAALAVVGLLAAGAIAQQPAKPPPLPAINPAQARLDQTIGGLDGPGLAVAANDEAGIVAAACEQGTIQYWGKGVTMGVRTGERTPNLLQAHQGPVTALAWGAGGVLASAGADRKVILWDMPEGKARHTLPTEGTPRALAMSADGRLVAAAGDSGAITVWETATGKPRATLAGHTDWVLALAFSADGSRLASGGYDEIVRVWDVGAGKKLLEFPGKPPAPPKGPAPPDNTVLALAFSPDGKQLAVGGTDAQIHLFNPADGKLIRPQPGHHGDRTRLP